METTCILFAKDHLAASSAKALLETNGIICLFPNEYFTGVYPNYSVISGGFSLYVSINDVEEANKVLEPHRESFEVKKQAAPNTDSERCPSCNTKDVEVLFSNRILVRIFFALFNSFPTISKKYTKRCKFCGHEWN